MHKVPNSMVTNDRGCNYFGNVLFSCLILLHIGLAVSTEPCEYYLTTNITDGKRELDNSWLHNDLHYPVSLYASYNYVLDERSNRLPAEPHMRGCTCLLRSCLTTCCAPGEYVNYNNGEGDGACRHGGGYTSVKWNVGVSDVEKIDLLIEFTWAVKRPDCKLHFLEPQYVESDTWYLLHNGSVYLPFDDNLLEHGRYCVGLETEEKDGINVTDLVVLKCIDQAEEEARFVFLPIGMFLSVPFLLATFIVYALIPELRNVHGKSLMSYVFGLTVGYTILASVQFYGNKTECRDGSMQCFPNKLCVILGYTIYTSFMVSFFWLNTMCFDIFWTFKGVRGNVGAKHNFKFYCLYAWGVPVLLTLFLITIQYTNVVGDDYKPNIGQGTCFFESTNVLVEFLYLYLILIILICSNILFFVITAIRIKKVQQETSAITNQGSSARHSRHSYEKYRFWLYLRLFVVMGVTWSLEVISWAVDPKSYYFYVTDLYNCIQGILIFFLVVWNEKVKKLVVKRINKFRGITDPDTQTSFRTAVTTSVNLRRSTSIPLEQKLIKI